MNLLLTNDEMDEVRGGTQTSIMDLAQALKGRGHKVAVYSWLCGSLASELRALGVPVVDSPRDCGFIPDVIHGQHHLAAMTALCAFPGVPAVYHCHGYGPWQEQPPKHPRITHYVGMAQAMALWMASVTGRKLGDIVIIPNSVHLGRFQKVRHLPRTPQRALLFGNTFIPGESISKLRRACTRCGMTLDLVGAQFGNATSAPQDLLPEYDIVFAIGRSALEALASGCAVVPFTAAGCSAMVHMETLRWYIDRNFTVPENVAELTMKLLVQRIRQFEPGRAAAATSAIRLEAGFDRTCERLENLYRQAMEPLPGPAASCWPDEALALSVYLKWLGPHVKGADDRFTKLRAQREKSKERIAKLQLKLRHSEQRWQRVEARLPGILRRWFLRDIR
jgi:glycosyltransferase involved in cell wall biosynthesis